jgi:hypothetical protein
VLTTTGNGGKPEMVSYTGEGIGRLKSSSGDMSFHPKAVLFQNFRKSMVYEISIKSPSSAIILNDYSSLL